MLQLRRTIGYKPYGVSECRSCRLAISSQVTIDSSFPQFSSRILRAELSTYQLRYATRLVRGTSVAYWWAVYHLSLGTCISADRTTLNTSTQVQLRIGYNRSLKPFFSTLSYCLNSVAVPLQQLSKICNTHNVCKYFALDILRSCRSQKTPSRSIQRRITHNYSRALVGA